jgi:hypothetical protein
MQFVAPLFWQDGEQGLIGGTLAVLMQVLWIPVFMGLFDLVREKMPHYAAWGFLVASYANVGGAIFGFRDIYSATFNISQAAELQAFVAHSLVYNLTLFWPGYMFPLSLLVIGIMLIRCKSVPWWIGLLICLGAVAFPVGRISRLPLVALAVNLLLLVPMLYLAWTFLASQSMRIRIR